MPKIKPITRKSTGDKYGGSPCELLMCEPSTYRQIIKYYYHIMYSNPNSDFISTIHKICNDVKSIWRNVNPRLPLLTDKSLFRKVKDLLTVVKDINRKHGKVSAKKNLDKKLDRLFDISACTCPLDVKPCYDRMVNCKIENCEESHIICVCSNEVKVPLEDRSYLRDQRSKTGPKGAYQLSSIDRSAIKRDKMLRVDAVSSSLKEAQSGEMHSVPSEPSQESSSSSSSTVEVFIVVLFLFIFFFILY